MSYKSDIWLYPLQDWWKMVNEMSNFMSTGPMGNFISHPVKLTCHVSKREILKILVASETRMHFPTPN